MSLSLIRWSGLALMLGGVLQVLFSFIRLSQENPGLYVLVNVAIIVLTLFGLAGLQTLQSKQSGRLGFVALVILAGGLLMAFAMQMAMLFGDTSLLLNIPVLFGVAAVQILGFVLLGISINRAGAFSRHSGNGLIITSLLILVAGTRLLLAIFLVGLGYRIFSGKVPSQPHSATE